MPDTLSPIVETRGHRPIPTRLQLASANRMAAGLDYADAQQKASELFSAMDDFLRAMKALQACGASKAFLWDCATGLEDQVRNVQFDIDRELDARSGQYLEPLDLSELADFIREVE